MQVQTIGFGIVLVFCFNPFVCTEAWQCNKINKMFTTVHNYGSVKSWIPSCSDYNISDESLPLKVWAFCWLCQHSEPSDIADTIKLILFASTDYWFWYCIGFLFQSICLYWSLTMQQNKQNLHHCPELWIRIVSWHGVNYQTIKLLRLNVIKRSQWFSFISSV